jgi:nitroreductase
MAPFDLSQVDRLLSTTPAVRRRLDLDRPVGREAIVECLRLATYAPSAENNQNWRWIVVTDAGTRAQIAEIWRTKFYRNRPPEAEAPDYVIQSRSGDPAMTRVLNGVKYLADNLHRVPVFVIPCCMGRPNSEGVNVRLSTMYGSIIQAVWSFQLALRSRGLGSAWTTMHLHAEDEVAAILGVPEDFTQIALIPVAYSIGDDFRPPPRQPVEDVIYWNRWEGDAG